MPAATPQPIEQLEVIKTQTITAPIEIVFEAILDELGPESIMPPNKPFPMVVEPWPGGRWFRDLGNNAGHFWGHVQVIKPPTLLELRGPMFMSYPAENFIQYRLVAEGERTTLNFLHRAFGLIPKDHMEGVNEGWEFGFQRIRQLAEARVASGKAK